LIVSITNVVLIRNSLSLINVLGVGEAAEIEHSELGIRKLNALLADWEADSVDLQFYPQTIDDLGGDCPIPDHAELAVTYYLAFALAPHYGKQVAPEMVALGQKYYDRLVRDAVKEQIKEVKIKHLPQGEGQNRADTDIFNG
jgi:hypothetical protein